MKKLWIVALATALAGCSARESTPPSGDSSPPQKVDAAKEPVRQSRVQLEEIQTGKDGRSDFEMEIDISEPDGQK